jgi:hypothetical protein
MIAILGSIFLGSGMLQTLLTTQKPGWFLIFPYSSGSSPYDFLGLAFTLIGVILFLSGIVLAVHYAALRSWYSNALKEGYRVEEEKLKAQKKHQDSFPLPEAAKEVNPLTNFLEPAPESKHAAAESS